jgi:hypothetical protein
MTNFLHWRKMTWAILLWSGAMLAWIVVGAATAADGAAGCASDFGATSSNLTEQDCINAAGSGSAFGPVLIAALWLAGLILLSTIWFATRPLWRHGRGLRLRRLRRPDIPWSPKSFS